MRIGIITVPFNNNYGGYLQAFALMTILKRMGHEPTMIMRRHNPNAVSFLFRLKFFIKGLIKTIVKRKKYPCIYTCETFYKERGKNMHTFVDKYIVPQTKYIYSTEDLRKTCDGKFDAYIVGSDQVWRSIYVPGIVGNMFLDFTKGWDVKRIAYAASFGTDTLEYSVDERNICGKLIQKFDAISVREASGEKVIEDYGWMARNIETVLDPTMLLNSEDYNRILPSNESPAKGKIFCYILDKSENTSALVSAVSSELNKDIYEIADIQKGNSVLPSVEEWLSAIRDADFVITDSFHGTVFSIILNKNFYVCPNIDRGCVRFEALLSRYGLLDRIIQSNKWKKRGCDVINWDMVRNIQKEEQEKSLNFLYEILNSTGLE